MGKLKSVAKTAIAAKIIEVVRREAAKPQNQAKARELLDRVTRRASSSHPKSRTSRIIPGRSSIRSHRSRTTKATHR